MINFDEIGVTELWPEYRGSEKKLTVKLSDGTRFLFKFPDPIRELRKAQYLSYINNAFSEYIGCKIFESVGLPVQEVYLGTYTHKGKTKITCACKDLRKQGESFVELESIKLTDLDENSPLTFDYVERLSENIEGIEKEAFLDYYYDQFIVDALIGNTDRHLGNCAVIVDEFGKARISPTFDCGSSLCPTFADEQLTEPQNKALGEHSAIRDAKGERINYHTFITSCQNKRVIDSLLGIVPHINSSRIELIIDEIEGISEKRKEFYKAYIDANYSRTLFQGVVNYFKSKQKEVVIKSGVDLYSFYKDNLSQLKDLENGATATVLIGGREINGIKNKNSLFIMDDDIAVGIIKLQSNNDTIRDTVKTLENLGISTGLTDPPAYKYTPSQGYGL